MSPRKVPVAKGKAPMCGGREKPPFPPPTSIDEQKGSFSERRSLLPPLKMWSWVPCWHHPGDLERRSWIISHEGVLWGFAKLLQLPQMIRASTRWEKGLIFGLLKCVPWLTHAWLLLCWKSITRERSHSAIVLYWNAVCWSIRPVAKWFRQNVLKTWPRLA